jgi:hypothetical protein
MSKLTAGFPGYLPANATGTLKYHRRLCGIPHAPNPVTLSIHSARRTPDISHFASLCWQPLPRPLPPRPATVRPALIGPGVPLPSLARAPARALAAARSRAPAVARSRGRAVARTVPPPLTPRRKYNPFSCLSEVLGINGVDRCCRGRVWKLVVVSHPRRPVLGVSFIRIHPPGSSYPGRAAQSSVSGQARGRCRLPCLPDMPGGRD